MHFTDAEWAERCKRLHASEWASALGIGKYADPAFVYGQKVGLIPQQEHSNKYAEFGRWVEPRLIEWLASRLPPTVNVYPNSVAFNSLAGWYAATPDGFVESETGETLATVQCKAHSAYNADAWGEECSDQIPPETIVQTHVEMRCCNTDLAYVPALIDYEPRLYVVRFDDEFWREIYDRALAFWHGNVHARVPPEPTGTDGDKALTLALSPERNGTEREAAGDVLTLMSRLRSAQTHEKNASAITKGIKSVLARRLGSARAFVAPFGKFIRTKSDSYLTKWKDWNRCQIKN